MQIVRDLDAAVATFRQLGLHVVPGGEHPNWGTHNALCYFDDLTYIELLAIRSEADALNSDMGGNAHRYLAGGEGIATTALRSENIADDAARMRDRGVAVTGPIPGSRRRPDGSLLTWQLALPDWPQPFLIQWGDTAQERRADLIARGALAPHPMAPSGLRLERVAWAVTDLAAGAAWLRTTYGLEAGQPYADPELGARCADTGAGLVLCEPAGPGPGPVQQQLAARGAGPFLYDLTAAADTPARLISPDQANGAWLRVRSR
jgi:hypothetical protein